MSDAKADSWLAGWMESVANGQSTMSQRAMSSVEKHGGARALRAAAKKHGVHLLLITDDKGKQVVAASRDPFKVLC